jgi:hypothetical protein
MRIQLATKDDDGVLIDPPALLVGDDEVLYRPQQTQNGWEWNLAISVRPLKVIGDKRKMPAISDEHLHFG